MSKTEILKVNNTSIIKKVLIIIVVFVVLTIMIGTKNINKIDHAMFVTAIGIDKSPTDPNKILVTFQIVPPQVTSQSSTDVSKVIVTSLNEDSLEKAVAATHNYMSALINFSHTRAIVFSEEIARNGILKYLNSISSNHMYDTNMYVLVSRSSAQKYLESMSQTDEVNPILYYNIIRNSFNISSTTKPVTVMQFLKQLYDPYVDPTSAVCNVISNSKTANLMTNNKKPTLAESSDPINYSDKESQNPSSGATSSSKNNDNSEGKIDNTKNSDENIIQQKSNVKIEIGGMAVFSDDKLVGFLNLDETAYHLMLNNKIKSYYLSIKHPGEKEKVVKTNIRLGQIYKAKVHVNLKSNTPLIDILVPLSAYILDTEDKTYDFYNEEYMNKMKEYIIKELEKNVLSYTKKLQNDYMIDIDDYIEYCKDNFLTSKEMNEYDWKSKYLKAKIKVNFDIRFLTTGLSVEK